MRKIIIALLGLNLLLTGCAVNFYKTTPKDRIKIQKLKGEVDRLNELMAAERKEFEGMKRDLERKFKDKRVSLEVQDRGLVITLANNILFDSGRAKIKKKAYSVFDKIVSVLKTTARQKNIGIEGHTDNVPIKYSSWKSNRELSTARANNVYHYIVGKGVAPNRLTTIGYGEYRPIVSNSTKEGRAKNRRVEIVILPEYTKEGKAAGKLNNQWVK